MKKQNMVGFRLKLRECVDPDQLVSKIKPQNCVDSVWIPQTLGDQIWVWFEFANKEDKKEYVKWVKTCGITSKDMYNNDTHPKDMFMHTEKWLTQKQIDHWTK